MVRRPSPFASVVLSTQPSSSSVPIPTPQHIYMLGDPKHNIESSQTSMIAHFGFELGCKTRLGWHALAHGSYERNPKRTRQSRGSITFASKETTISKQSTLKIFASSRLFTLTLVPRFPTTQPHYPHPTQASLDLPSTSSPSTKQPTSPSYKAPSSPSYRPTNSMLPSLPHP